MITCAGAVDIITGSGGADVMVGAGGADQLNGGGGVDTITGGAAADLIDLGSDSVIDQYITTGGVATVDTITNFTVGSGGDVLQIDLSDLNGVTEALHAGGKVRTLSNVDGEDATTSTNTVVNAGASVIVAADIDADIIQITGDIANVADMTDRFETGGGNSNTITFTKAFAAGDAFLVLWHDATHGYLSYVHTGVINAGAEAEAETLTGVNLIKFAALDADNQFTADNFNIIT